MVFSHISSPVRQLTGRNFARKFITLGRVITYWPEIVGAQLAAKTCPVGMSVRKSGSGKQGAGGKKLEAILEISASSAEATLLHYQKPLILERLRHTLGETIVVDLRIVHGGARLQPRTALMPPTPLTNPDKTCQSMGLENIRDPELRAALESFGRWLAH